MPSFGSYTAWIEVDNERLSEFDATQEIQPDGSMKVSCWIPSAAGKTFKIGYAETERLTSSQVHVAVDGSECSTAHLLRSMSSPPPFNYGKFYREGVETRSGLLPFSFGNCQLTDDDSASVSVEGVGEIEVLFYDCVAMGSYPREAVVEFDDAESDQLSQPRQIHERAKKGLVHSVQLDKKVLDPPGRIMQYHRTIKGGKRVTFLFRYRPLDVLRADGIAPRPAPPVQTKQTTDTKPRVVIDLTLPEPTPRKFRTHRGVIDLTFDSDEDEDDDQTLIKRLQGDIAAAKRRVDQKRKREETGEGSSRRLKREFKTESV